ncbi:unnamed protein product [Tilletia controversa]|nr:unnamed protein product [Tilletia controversa]
MPSSSFSSLRIQRDPAFPHAKLPTRGSAAAAGYDLYAAEDVLLPGGNGRKVVPTGIKLAVPEGCYGRVAPRSGLASKHGIDVGAGVIDADYRGLLGVLLFNFGDADFQIKAGDRIAQLVLEQIRTPDVAEVENLEETDRGAGGFGSTGGFGINDAAAAAAATAAAALGAPSPKKRRTEDAEGNGLPANGV